MAKYKIVGVQRKSGEYEGRSYDNTYLHTLGKNTNVIGDMVDTIKIKTPAFNNILMENSIKEIDLIGKLVDISFDKYRNVEYVEILDKK